MACSKEFQNEGKIMTREACVLAPHIHSPRSVAERYWKIAASLAPLFGILFFIQGAEILRFLLMSLVSAVAFEFLGSKLRFRKEHIANGETILGAAVFSLLLPSRCPSEVIVFGNFLAVFVARELLGGTGSSLFHPVLLARVFLQLSFPGIFNAEPLMLITTSPEWILGAMGACSVIALWWRTGCWEIPLLFIPPCFLFSVILGTFSTTLIFFSMTFFTAFFLLGVPVAMPLTRNGTRVFVLGAALLSVVFSDQGLSINAVGYAVLFMNLFTPWMDRVMKPVPYKRWNNLKATYDL